MEIVNKGSEKFVIFKLDEQTYGVSINDVQIIEKMKNTVRVPKAPACVDGVMNLRGEILPVIAIRRLFGMDEKVTDGTTRIIIIKILDSLVGIIVDSIQEVTELDADSIDKSKNLQSDSNAYIYGVGKTSSGEIITLLNTKNTIESAFMVTYNE